MQVLRWEYGAARGGKKYGTLSLVLREFDAYQY